MFNRVLVVYDGSPGAKRALNSGLKLAKMVGSECHLVKLLKKPEHVSDIKAFHQEAAGELTFVEKESDRPRFLTSLAGFDLPTHTIAGESCEELKNFVQKGMFDLVVVTPRKDNMIKDIFFGSYVEKLLRKSDISVLVVQ
ncbi:MAG: Universal stress protein family protein [Pelotomaculum sp. PtaB.Bin013]|uniref:Universal stress protein n=1 Tax=Pelotomaculum isophthalicicum JI TaxID=947010 RepID=A0A9X4JWJ2_9FIRM|nr:universal stress protein [Pelotomaculum isophthalicicum]MDF9409447.1 universal stress protein [Pelotomaculum isophthalicicum JI]OPX82825.1 MAG: Universal stress protein family protein [Pelotomaculum sp. PtaB.Bin013]